MTTVNDSGVEVRRLSKTEAWELFDRTAQRELGLSGKDFLSAWDAGRFDADADRPDVMHVAMLLPLVRASK